MDECFKKGFDFDKYCKTNKKLMSIPSPYPEAQNNYYKNLFNECFEEYMKLPDEEKIEYLEPHVKNFVCCLKTKSPTYKDFSNGCPVF